MACHSRTTLSTGFSQNPNSAGRKSGVGQAALISLHRLRAGLAQAAFDRSPFGALAQLGERLICIQEVIGSIPIGSTSNVSRDHRAHPRMRSVVP